MENDRNTAGGVGSEAGGDIRDAAGRVADDAREMARETGDRARAEAEKQADRARSGVADEVSNVADALRKAADDMRSGSPQERAFGQIAESLADASDVVRDRDLGQIAGDVSDFARRNPLAFLGGAALAGFAATRFAKASARSPRESQASGGLGGTQDHGARAGTDRFGMPVGAARDNDTPSGPDRTPSPVTQGASVGSPARPVDHDAIPGPATASVAPVAGTGTAAGATPSPTATKPGGST